MGQLAHYQKLHNNIILEIHTFMSHTHHVTQLATQHHQLQQFNIIIINIPPALSQQHPYQ